MKGHEHLIAMRLRRLVPIMVYIDTADTGALTHMLNSDEPSRAHVWIEPGDSIALLDLRCLYGLQVSITGTERERVEATIRGAKEAVARRVIGIVLRYVGKGAYERAETIRHTDTLGDYEWEAEHGELAV